MNLSEGNGGEKKGETMARNLSGRDESHSINENDRWVFDDLGCNIVEEAGLRRSIGRQSHCLCTQMDFIGQKLGVVGGENRTQDGGM